VLRQELQNLQAAIVVKAPHLVDRFNSGIKEKDLRQLEVQLLPYFLPESLRSIYRWHEGADEPLELIPGYVFLTFQEAVEEYRMQFELDGGAEGWNPLWFPFMSLQGDNYCVLLSTERRPDSSVYLMYNQDTEFRMMFRDVGALIETAKFGFESGAYRINDDYLEIEEDDFEQLRSKLGDRAPLVHVDGVTSHSRHFTQNWPREWRKAIGRNEDDYKLQGADCTVPEYLQNPRKARLRLRIRGLVGTSDAAMIDVEDNESEMTIYCPRTARGARELQIGRTYEMEIEPGQPTETKNGECSGTVQRMILVP
jgi:cell wall assembly regulator SMI1